METKIEVMHTQQEVNFILAGLQALNKGGLALEQSASLIALFNKLNSALQSAQSVNMIDDPE